MCRLCDLLSLSLPLFPSHSTFRFTSEGGVSDHDDRWGKLETRPPASVFLSLTKSSRSRLARLFVLDRPPLGGMPFRSFTYLMGQTECLMGVPTATATTARAGHVPTRLTSSERRDDTPSRDAMRND
ncbi:hypothetical protein PRIPAC_93714 [Pristionchus pacificus]|uniref:Uncharacterized protein n=1 Tax=Pristionchus pacificus TaxID=54126 RepID=A0A2A6CDC0_PRIPA|nr:hypothetical protein PRIPAC_93714 [Pristionchus pacificus]|eukprot:PDM76001.1 hypothetical protein PRIPAC_39605 [Pristionchus pacificus]